MRQDVLKNIISTVKNNKELALNNNFDYLIDDGHHDERHLRSVQSMEHLNLHTPDEMKGEDDRRVQSFPGSPHNLRRGEGVTL